jgi:N-acyl-L-homoserine lactone synthetase
MIECVTLENCHLFEGNPLRDQHRLRYASIIERQQWNIPAVNRMEYDSYDNPASCYLVKRDEEGRAIGTSRLYPTDRPYMLQQAFPHMVTKIPLPQDKAVWEGSRFCVDASLPPEARKKIIQEIVVGYLEFALARNIKSIIGVMYPVYWKNIFIKSGWNVEWLGDVHKSTEGHKIIAGNLPVSPAVLQNVRAITGIHETVLCFGREHGKQIAA